MDKAKHAQYRRLMNRDAAFSVELPISKAAPANELLPTRAMPAERNQHLTPENVSSWLLPPRTETLAARAAKAGGLERRVAELEGVLNAAREALVLQKREKSLLQVSLDRVAGDNTTLAGQLAEREASLRETRSQLEQIKAMFEATDTERNRLTIAVKEANERRESDVDRLNARLSTTSARASRADAKLTEEIAARHAAEQKLQRLEDALRAKESQIQDREQVQAELVEWAGALLRTLEARNVALARAEETIKVLTATQAEPATSSPKPPDVTQQPEPKPQRERKEHTGAERVRKKTTTDQPLLKRDLDKDDWLLG
jgi:chromosome segregation ATPase